MDPERIAAVRELEMEYRYLAAVRAQSKMARVKWLETLADELMLSLQEFWAAIKRGEQ